MAYREQPPSWYGTVACWLAATFTENFVRLFLFFRDKIGPRKKGHRSWRGLIGTWAMDGGERVPRPPLFGPVGASGGVVAGEYERRLRWLQDVEGPLFLQDALLTGVTCKVAMHQKSTSLSERCDDIQQQQR